MKIFLPLITAVIIFISCFSVVLPIKADSDDTTPSHIPLPLSFPLYSIDKTGWIDFGLPGLSTEVYFLNSQIISDLHFVDDGVSVYTRLGHFVHYFLVINIVGAILGYGLSKAVQSIWRYFGRRKPETETT